MKQKNLRGTRSALYREFQGWNFNNHRDAYKYITEFQIRKYEDSNGAHSNKGNHNRGGYNNHMGANDFCMGLSFFTIFLSPN